MLVCLYALRGFTRPSYISGAGCTVQNPARLSVSHRFFRCFPVCVAFRIGICSVLAISRLSAHASFDLHSSFNSLRGFGGDGEGVMTSMRLPLVF